MEKPLTVEQEMAKFSGYTTNNGETVAPNDPNQRQGSTSADLSPEERAAGAKIVGGKEARAQGNKTSANESAKVELTQAESDAVLEALRADLQEGEELTDEEEAAALAEALTEKAAKAKTKNGPNERIARFKAARSKAEARAARAEARADTLEARLAALESGGTKPLDSATKDGKTATKDAEPDAKDFEFGEVDPKYIRALSRWEVRQELAETQKTQQTQQQTAEQRRAAAAFTAKREAFEDAAFGLYDDFKEVVLDTVTLPDTDPDSWPLSVTLRDLCFDSDQGPRVMYALASDPKEARRVEKLTVSEKQRWFFKQEAKYEAEAASGEQEEVEDGATRQQQQLPARQVSKAPPPPKRNNGGSGNKTVSSATTDFRAFEALASAAATPRR